MAFDLLGVALEAVEGRVGVAKRAEFSLMVAVSTVLVRLKFDPGAAWLLLLARGLADDGRPGNC